MPYSVLEKERCIRGLDREIHMSGLRVHHVDIGRGNCSFWVNYFSLAWFLLLLIPGLVWEFLWRCRR